jgi:hypothetical protein
MLSRGGSSAAMPLASRSPARRLIGATLVALSLSAGAVAAHGTPAGPPATLEPTPAFTAAWQQAKVAFNYCHYALAAKRYGKIKARGFRLSDLVLRYKFYDGIATATYAAGYRKTALVYAQQARKVSAQMTVAQDHVVQDEAGDIGDITLGEYYFVSPPSSAYCRAGGHFPA